MPLYEYRCADCGTEASRLLSLVAAPVRGTDGAAMPVAGGGGCCGGACGNC